MPRGVRKVQPNQIDIMDKIKAKLRFVDRVKDMITKLEEEIGERVGSDDVTAIVRASTKPSVGAAITSASRGVSSQYTNGATTSAASTSDAPRRRGRPPGSGKKKEPTNLAADPENPDSPPRRRGRPRKNENASTVAASQPANGFDSLDDAVEVEEVIEE